MKDRSLSNFRSLLAIALAGALSVGAAEPERVETICVVVDGGESAGQAAAKAIERLKDYSSANVKVVASGGEFEGNERVDLRIRLAIGESPRLDGARPDSYLVQTVRGSR